MLQNARVTAFTRSELLSQNQKGGGAAKNRRTRTKPSVFNNCAEKMFQKRAKSTIF